MMFNLLTKALNHQEILALREKYKKFAHRQWSESIKTRLIEDFTYHSTKIEGLELSYGDTINFLRKGIIRGDESLKDISDLKNHKMVLKQIFSSFDNLSLDVDTIKKLHQELMNDAINGAEKTLIPVDLASLKEKITLALGEIMPLRNICGGWMSQLP